ncbi:MAG TPA: ABC transporter permease [Bryobacteraceae bacterium]|nr:ABC transporter permease [Bryobacteraceae bacterium]
MIQPFRTAWLRLKALMYRRRLDRDLEEELRLHTVMRAQKFTAEGMPPKAAQAAAERQFGNRTRVRETCRELWTFSTIEALWQDVRYGLRTLAKAPVFSAVAIISLALGIGANTALFSLMDVMLMRELPVKNPQQLVEFIRASPSAMMTNLPYPVFSYFQRDQEVLEDVFTISPSQAVVNAGAGAERAQAHLVSGSFFPALGVNALMGRSMGPSDDRHSVAVLSHGFWSRRFGADPSILGRTVRVNGEPFTVVGVMPPAFFGVDRSEIPDLWLPIPAGVRPQAEVWVLGHLKPGVSVSQAQTVLEPLFGQALESLTGEIERWPERDRKAFLSQKLLIRSATSGTVDLEWTYWKGKATLKVLMGLTVLVLLIACVNLANLLMARSANRTREIGIRLGIGAGRFRLVRQLLTENLLLSLAGGAIGLVVAAWGHRLLLGFLVRDPQSVALDFRLDYRVLCFGLALSVTTCVLFGLMPALRATHPNLIGAIRGDANERGPARIPLARTLLPLQVALSMVLLMGAGLFARSLRNLGMADLGLVRSNLLMTEVRAPGKAPQEHQQFWTRFGEQVSAVPGVRSVALAGSVAFGSGGWNQTVWIDRAGQPAQDAKISHNIVSPGFFATVGIPVLIGRGFGEHDRKGSPLVAVVNQTFARRYLPNENPIGKRFGDRGRDSSGRYEIVGVVGDAKYGAVREPMRPMAFYPLLQQEPRNLMAVHVRTAAGPDALVPSIRRKILAIDGESLVSEIRTLPQVVRSQLRQDRMFATLAAFFAALALALAAIGIYGIVAYRVTRRMPEIGVRIAMGAQRKDVLWLVMKETLTLFAIGGLLGAACALVASRLIRSLLFALEPSDPATLASAGVILFTVGVFACLLPARRAASLDPLVALRIE